MNKMKETVYVVRWLGYSKNVTKCENSSIAYKDKRKARDAMLYVLYRAEKVWGKVSKTGKIVHKCDGEVWTIGDKYINFIKVWIDKLEVC